MSVADLKSFESALGNEGAEMLRAGMDAYPRVGQFLNALRDRYQATKIGRSVFSMAERSLLFDPNEGRDGIVDTVHSFIAGGLLGTHVAYNFLSLESRQLLCDIILPIHTQTNDDDVAGHEQDLALAVLDFGERGYDDSPAYHTLIEEYKDELSPSSRYHVFTRVGFGVVLNQINATYSMVRLLDAEELSAELERAQSVDYDTEFCPE